MIQPIEILHDLDLCSPQFFLDTVTGKQIQEATITFVRANNTGIQAAYFQIKLTNVLITGVESITVTQGQSTLQDPGVVALNEASSTSGVQEVVTLTFTKIQLTDLVSKHTVTFDLGKNAGL